MDSLNTLSKGFKSIGKKKKKTSQKPVNFIEALKDISQSSKKQAREASVGVAKTAMEQLAGRVQKPIDESGELKPGGSIDFEQLQQAQEQREKQIVKKERMRYQQRIERETLVFHEKQEQAKMQIASLQQELAKIASAAGNVSQEIKKATLKRAVEPGTYHENFFERIKRLLQRAKENIAKSGLWLKEFNRRGKKKGPFYWRQVKKSGTKYMLSQERYMATQVG